MLIVLTALTASAVLTVLIAFKVHIVPYHAEYLHYKQFLIILVFFIHFVNTLFSLTHSFGGHQAFLHGTTLHAAANLSGSDQEV